MKGSLGSLGSTPAPRSLAAPEFESNLNDAFEAKRSKPQTPQTSNAQTLNPSLCRYHKTIPDPQLAKPEGSVQESES